MTKRQSEVCFYPCNYPFWLTGLKVPTNQQQLKPPPPLPLAVSFKYWRDVYRAKGVRFSVSLVIWWTSLLASDIIWLRVLSERWISISVYRWNEWDWTGLSFHYRTKRKRRCCHDRLCLAYQIRDIDLKSAAFNARLAWLYPLPAVFSVRWVCQIKKKKKSFFVFFFFFFQSTKGAWFCLKSWLRAWQHRNNCVRSVRQCWVGREACNLLLL